MVSQICCWTTWCLWSIAPVYRRCIPCVKMLEVPIGFLKYSFLAFVTCVYFRCQCILRQQSGAILLQIVARKCLAECKSRMSCCMTHAVANCARAHVTTHHLYQMVKAPGPWRLYLNASQTTQPELIVYMESMPANPSEQAKIPRASPKPLPKTGPSCSTIGVESPRP